MVFTGTSVGLYGGTQDQHACDARQLKDFLAQNPDKASAWAGVEGITVRDIASFVDSLTPVVLTRDTWVTNHGFRDGKATRCSRAPGRDGRDGRQHGPAAGEVQLRQPAPRAEQLERHALEHPRQRVAGFTRHGRRHGAARSDASPPSSWSTSRPDRSSTNPSAPAPGVAVALESSGAYGNGGQILVNAGGVNGPTWERDPVDASYLTDVAYGNGYFLAVGPGTVSEG